MNNDPAPERVPLYTPEFLGDPANAYARLHSRGGYIPVELAPGVPATLVIGYDAALEVLRDPGTFPKDPRRWEKTVSPDCPLLPLLSYRPQVLHSDGAEHARLREVITHALDQIDTIALREHVEYSADILIDRFGAGGKADLRSGYAAALPLMALSRVFGCPPDIADRLVAAVIELLSTGEDKGADIAEALAELVAFKRAHPGPDATSRMVAHPAGLTDQEVVEQLMLVMFFGLDPTANLITSVLGLLLSDDRFAGDLSGGSLAVEHALDEALWSDPPLASLSFTYPTHDLEREGVRLVADQPVLVSCLGAHSDPSKQYGPRTGNRAHLAWGAGPHTCPAKGHARLIASVAIEKLLDRLPDLRLAVPAAELQRRPGPLSSALAVLPVLFTPVPVQAPAPVQAAPAPEPAAPPRPPVPLPAAPPAAERHAPSFLARLVARWRS